MSSSRLSCAERLLLRCVETSGILSRGSREGSLISSLEAETELLWRWPDPRASSRVETGMSGNFLSCSKGVKDPLEVPEFRCDYSRDAAEKMGLISTGAENLLDFLELRQVLSTYDRDLRDSVADVSRFPSRGSRDLLLSL